MEVIEHLTDKGLDSLCQQYAIKASRHEAFPNLVLLKYDQINSPMSERIVRQCRGLIVDESDGWRIISYPFDKFFNHGEGHAAMIDWHTARVMEKLDGSLMTLYPYADRWWVSSSGMPDAAGPVYGFSFSFSDLFWKIWNQLGYSMPVDNRRCYMFEMMTPYNRIVVPHQTCRLGFLGSRSLDTLQESGPESGMDEWERVKSFPLGTLAEVLSSCNTINPMESEGFVVCDASFNRIKVKSPQYVAMAHLRGSCSPRRLLEIVRANESSEFLNYFPEIRPVYEVVQSRYAELCGSLESAYQSIKGIGDQKAFAAEACKSQCSSALFAVRAGKAENVRAYFASATMGALERAINLDDVKMPWTETGDQP